MLKLVSMKGLCILLITPTHELVMHYLIYFYLLQGALLISAEDQAFRFLNKEKDILAIQNETSTSSTPSTSTRVIPNVDGDSISLGVLSVAAWMEKFDDLVKEVEAQLIEHGDRRRPLQILKAVNSVLFKIRELKRTHSSSDPLRSYVDHVLTLGSGTGENMIQCGVAGVCRFACAYLKADSTIVYGTTLSIISYCKCISRTHNSIFLICS